MQTAALFLVTLTVIIYVNVYDVTAVVENSDIPLHMAQCYGYFKKKTNVVRTPAAAIQHYCDNNYMWMKAQELNIQRGASPEGL